LGLIGRLTGGRSPGALARGAGTAFILQGLGAGLAFALQVSLGNWMGPRGYGAYSFTVAWAGLVAVVAGLGLPSTVLRFVPAYISNRDWPRLRGILRVSVLLTFALTGSLALLGTGIAFLVGAGEPSWNLVLGLWLVPLLAFRTLAQEVVRGFRRIGLAYGPSFVLRPALIIAGCGAFLSLHGDLTSEAALAVTAATMVVMLALQAAWFWFRVEPDLRSAGHYYETRSWLRVALPLLLIASFTVVLSETDIVMVGAFLGAKEAGIYTAASKTAGVVGLVLLSVNAVAAPMFSSLYAEGRHEDLARLATKVAKWTFWPALAISVVLAVGANPILGLFGPEFHEARWMLIALLFGQVLSAAVGSVGYLMTMTGHQGDAARVYVFVAVSHVALNAIAIPLIGALGAAIATTTSISIWNLWLHSLVVKKLDIHPSVAPGLFSRKPRPS
jgi:O-antigen/teichoic acid export membrane protein